jgi:hypothetical protein
MDSRNEQINLFNKITVNTLTATSGNQFFDRQTKHKKCNNEQLAM